MLLAAASTLQAQGQNSPEKAKQAKQQPAAATPKTSRVRVTSREPILISIHAKEALLTEVAAELGQKLKVTVTLSPVMQKQRVTLDFDSLPLEGALRILSPRPYADYEIKGGSAAASRVIAIYLYALNEEPPKTSAALKNNTQTIIIEGDTESIADPSKQQKNPDEVKPLKVSVGKEGFKVSAKRQPLSAVLYEIANSVNIPLEVQYESNELIDLDYKGASLEDVVRTTLPATVRLYVRTDLTTLESRPLLIALVATPAS